MGFAAATVERQQVFNALADPTRLDIVQLLATSGQMNATEICENFEISHPAISQHLRVLREAELVRLEKQAQRHIYSLNIDAMRRLENWIVELTERWDESYSRLDEVLEREKRKMANKRR